MGCVTTKTTTTTVFTTEKVLETKTEQTRDAIKRMNIILFVPHEIFLLCITERNNNNCEVQFTYIPPSGQCKKILHWERQGWGLTSNKDTVEYITNSNSTMTTFATWYGSIPYTTHLKTTKKAMTPVVITGTNGRTDVSVLTTPTATVVALLTR